MSLLRNRDWQFPIGNLIGKIYESKVYSLVELNKLQLALSSISREWDFLSLLWERLQNEFREKSEALEKRLRLKARLIDSELDKKSMKSSILLELDLEDFLIHAKMLMDSVVQLTKMHFLDKIVTRGAKPSDGFTKFRNWFIEKDNSAFIIDSEFTDYIRENTDWYEDLQKVRDKLIMHMKGYHTSITSWEIGRRVYFGKARPKFSENEDLVDLTDVKYFPNLDKLMDKITEFLSFYDKHFAQILEKSN